MTIYGIYVNGVMVTCTRTKSPMVAERWKSDNEFAVRATLKAAGVQRATVAISDGVTTVTHEWVAVDSCYGAMREGVVTGPAPTAPVAPRPASVVTLTITGVFETPEVLTLPFDQACAVTQCLGPDTLWRMTDERGNVIDHTD